MQRVGRNCMSGVRCTDEQLAVSVVLVLDNDIVGMVSLLCIHDALLPRCGIERSVLKRKTPATSDYREKPTETHAIVQRDSGEYRINVWPRYEVGKVISREKELRDIAIRVDLSSNLSVSIIIPPYYCF